MFEHETVPDPQELFPEPHDDDDDDDFPFAPMTTTGAFFTGIPRPQPKSVAASVATMAIAAAILAPSLPLLIFICFAFALTVIGSSFAAIPPKRGAARSVEGVKAFCM